MKSVLLALVGILVGIALVSTLGISMVNAQEASENEFPSWIKKNMVWWVEGLIEDNEMKEMLKFLLKDNIIKVDSSKMITQEEQLENDELQEKNDELQNTLKLERTIKVENNMSEETTEIIAQKDREISGFVAKIILYEETIETLNAAITDNNRIITEREAKIEEHEASFTSETDPIKDDYKLDLKNYENQLVEKDNKLVEKDKEIQRLKDEIQAVGKIRGQLEDNIKELKQIITNLDNN